jgi:hypothetical protein
MNANGYVYETFGISKHFPVKLQLLLIRAETFDNPLTAKCFIYDVGGSLFFSFVFITKGLVTVSCRVWCLNFSRLDSTKLFSRRLKNRFVKSYSDFLRNPLLLQHQSQYFNMMNPILFSLILVQGQFLYPNS